MTNNNNDIKAQQRAAAVAGIFFSMLLAGCESADELAIASARERVTAQINTSSEAEFSGEFIVRRPTDNNGFTSQRVCGFAGKKRFVVVQTKDRGQRAPYSAIAYIETIDHTPTAATAHNPQKDDYFDQEYWNANCIDATHSAMHSGA